MGSRLSGDVKADPQVQIQGLDLVDRECVDVVVRDGFGQTDQFIPGRL